MNKFNKILLQLTLCGTALVSGASLADEGARNTPWQQQEGPINTLNAPEDLIRRLKTTTAQTQKENEILPKC